jgi:effector-binding domain-containing protein
VQEKHESAHAVIVRSYPPRQAISIRTKVGSSEAVPFLFADLTHSMSNIGMKPSGPPMVIWYDRIGEGTAEVAIGAHDIEGAQDYGLGILDLDEIEQGATCSHFGAYESIERTYQKLSRWIRYNGFKKDGPCREIYSRFAVDEANNLEWDPQLLVNDPKFFVTEVICPVRHAMTFPPQRGLPARWTRGGKRK